MSRTSLCLLLGLVVPTGCDRPASPPATPPSSDSLVLSIESLNLVSGQTIYVPAYTQLGANPKPVSLDTSVAVHNTDSDHAIIIESIKLYDTHGALVSEYVETPVRLVALGAKVIPLERLERGLGANVIVKWSAETVVSEPIVEAIMFGRSGTHGYSMISPGRVVDQTR